MIQIDENQMAELVRLHFFQKVAAFIGEQSSIPAYREIARDITRREALWAPHWPLLSVESEHDAALFMCFLLACAMLEIDTARAAVAAHQAADPEMSMKTFLSERGLLRFSAFELPKLTAQDAEGADHGVVLEVVSSVSKGPMRGLLSGRSGEGCAVVGRNRAADEIVDGPSHFAECPGGGRTSNAFRRCSGKRMRAECSANGARPATVQSL